MSRVSFALAVAAVVVATPSFAADMYGNQRAPSAYSGGGYSDNSGSAASWNGAYVGGQLGYGWGRDGLHGNQIGIYGGVNATVGSNVVVGGEVDLNMSGQRRASVTAGSVREDFSDWNGSIRARVGVAIDRFLPYATAGLALADDTVKYAGTSDSQTRVGYVIGAGVEGKVVDRITAKGEFLYEGFGSTTHAIGGLDHRNNPSSAQLRAGVAYHF